MTASYFVDSNVLIYLHEGGEKGARATEIVGALADAEALVTSPQVVGEVYVNVRRSFGGEAARNHVRKLLATASLQPLDERTTDAALAIAERYELTYWDAQICAAAAASGARGLLTEDMQDGQAFGDVRVRNPFASDFDLDELR